MKCTWRGCTEEATCPQHDSPTTLFANLCSTHGRELNEAFAYGDYAGSTTWIRAWRQAQGWEPDIEAGYEMSKTKPTHQGWANA